MPIHEVKRKEYKDGTVVATCTTCGWQVSGPRKGAATIQANIDWHTRPAQQGAPR